MQQFQKQQRQQQQQMEIVLLKQINEKETERKLMSHISLVCTLMSPIKNRYYLAAPFSSSFKRDESKVDEEEFVEDVVDEHVSFIR